MYGSWANMIDRCHRENNKSFDRYGGRGIIVCDRWRYSFDNFLADMGEPEAGMSIERKNNDGNYEPGNCKWATMLEQASNKSSNWKIEFEGQIFTTARAACERAGIPHTGLTEFLRSVKASKTKVYSLSKLLAALE